VLHSSDVCAFLELRCLVRRFGLNIRHFHIVLMSFISVVALACRHRLDSVAAQMFLLCAAETTVKADDDNEAGAYETPNDNAGDSATR